MKFTIVSENEEPIFITEGVTGDLSGGPGVPKTTYGLFKDQGISSEVLQLRCPELEQALKVIEFYATADYSGCEFCAVGDEAAYTDSGQKAREFLE